jgi:agmatine/peptidylarginine deiminase
MKCLVTHPPLTKTQHPTNVKLRPTASDPTASKYQVSPEFGPDKTNTWSFPPEEDGWMHAHNAIRGELLILTETVCLLEGQG